MTPRDLRLATALVLALSCTAAGQVAVIRIQVVAGAGEVHAPGARSARPLTVLVTDEAGRPVEGATVTFHLPEDGSAGMFSNGLRTEVEITGAGGRAVVRGLRAGRTPGPFQIRVIASKEQARAGVVVSQYIAESRSGAAQARPRGLRKWIAVAALAAGGVAAGILAGRSGHAENAPTPPAPPAVGPPSITVGAP